MYLGVCEQNKKKLFNNNNNNNKPSVQQKNRIHKQKMPLNEVLVLILKLSVIIIGSVQCTTNDNVTNPTAADIIDGYDEKLPLVKVTFIHSGNKIYTLDMIDRRHILEHINVYLTKFFKSTSSPSSAAPGNSDIMLNITEFDGIIRVNGVLAYNVIHMYDESSYFHTCSRTTERDPLEAILTRRSQRCTDLQLACLPLMDDNDRRDIYGVVPHAILNDATIRVYYTDRQGVNDDFYEPLSSITDRRLIKHLYEYTKRHSTVKHLYVSLIDGLISINNEFMHKIIPMQELKSRMHHCTRYDKNKNAQVYKRSKDWYKVNYYNCADMYLPCH